MAEALGGRVKTPRPSRAPAERPTQPAAAATPPRAAATTPQSTRSNGSGAVTAPQQRILDQLAWLELHDIYPAPKETLAAVCGVSPTSGGYFNNLGRLRSCGLIDYPEPGLVALTNAGRAAAHLPDDSRPVHERWLSIVTNPQRKILEALIELYPQEITKAELARQVGVSETSGGFFNNLGRLRTIGAIDYPQPGRVALTRHVMPL